jgi:hypothetical protein
MNRIVLPLATMRISVSFFLLTVTGVGLLSSRSDVTSDDEIAKDIQTRVASDPKTKNAELSESVAVVNLRRVGLEHD